MMVLDASAAVDLLLDLQPRAPAIRHQIAIHGPEIAVPHLLDAEVAQVLRRQVAAGALSAARAVEALDDLVDLPVLRHAHAPLVHAAFRLRHDLTVYDGLYVVLAAALDAPLITCDAQLARLPLRRVAQIVLVPAR